MTENVRHLPQRPRLLKNPLDEPQMLAEALKEKHGAKRVLIRMEFADGNSFSCEAKS